MWLWILAGLSGFVVLLFLRDVLQKRHAILRNFPVIGHVRYLLESLGPGLRQYIVADNDEERPFSRDQRRWVYASAKRENNYFGFGTDNDLEQSPNHLIVKHAALPLAAPADEDKSYPVPCAKVLGGWRGRKHAFRPASIVNVSGMSFGSLGARAIQALNEGCAIAGCLHNTGEGGVSPYHDRGGDLIWQIGTGYFGCRDASGGFSLEEFVEVCESKRVRAVEVKLSQGAKPGLGGLLPGRKVTPEISRIRGIPVGKSCASPASHTAFRDVDELLDFVETLAEKTGLPVGIKSAVGELDFWDELTDKMATTGRGVDYVAVDGGEGGTGAAPLAFSDHVALPFKIGMSRVYRKFVARDLHQKVVFVGAGRLGFPDTALFAMGLGCDLIAVGREAMLALGCIQAQECHTGHCPTGVATHSKWLQRGLDPTDKSHRLANYIITLRKEMLQLARACGHAHPALVPLSQLEILDSRLGSRAANEVFDYASTLQTLAADDREYLRIE